MLIIDPGHEYLLETLDGGPGQRLIFVKREGEKYPGNVGSHSGTTTQECLRVLIDRNGYVNNQIPCAETEAATELMKAALLLLEMRAARRHARFFPKQSLAALLTSDKCATCGHVGCFGHEDSESRSSDGAGRATDGTPF